MGALESGQLFLASVLAKLPAEAQAQAKAIFESPEAKDAVITIGDGALRQPDYSKAMNDLAAQRTELETKLQTLTTWYDDNKAALEEYVAIKPEYDTLKAGGSRPPTPPTPPTPPQPPADPRKVVEEVLGEQGPQFIQVAAWLAAKSGLHQQMFNEPLDTMALVNNPKLGKPIAGQPGRVFSLEDVYRETFGERVSTKQKEATEKAFNDEVTRRLTEERAKLASQPFPIRGAEPSVLDTLAAKDGPAAHTLDTAIAEYERLSAQRSQST